VQPSTDMDNERIEHLLRFYLILGRLERSIGGARILADCRGRMSWPARGVYFFREAGKNRSDSGQGPRIVRVGTHALKTGSKAKLWTRLSQHKRQPSTGGGNHRGPICDQARVAGRPTPADRSPAGKAHLSIEVAFKVRLDNKKASPSRRRKSHGRKRRAALYEE
jgi:hypothetical protein